MNFERVLIKVSGEALGGSIGVGLEQNSITNMAKNIQAAYNTNIEIAIVIGAGNIIRGTSSQFLSRTKADSAGMLGTAINAIALQDTLESVCHIPSIVLGAFSIDSIFMQATPALIERAFKEKKIIVFAGGIGAPFFSTDTAGVLKALEINADLMIKATKVDGVYDQDPHLYPNAQKFDTISFEEVLHQKLQIMDLTATSLAMENKLPIRVTNLSGENLVEILNGVPLGTLIS